LRHGEDLEPIESSEVTPCGFDVTQVDTKDLGNPRELTPATADAAMGSGVVVEAPEQVAEHGGDHGNRTAASDEAQCLAGYGHATLWGLCNHSQHGVEVHELLDAVEFLDGSRKGDAGAGPGEEAQGFEATQRCAEVRTPHPTDKLVEFGERVFWGLVGCKLTAPGDHFVAGMPDAVVAELYPPGAVQPPEQA
jgi:hypothetical protein